MAPPPRRWHVRHVLLWAALAAGAAWWQGPAFRRAFEPEFYPAGHQLFVPDFFQEWASARNHLTGLPVYAPQAVTAERYLGVRPDPADPYFIAVNAHPPTAVLLALPLAGLPFRDAFALWNVLSLAALAAGAGLIVGQLRLPVSAWDLLPALALLLPCYPLWHHLVHGQLNLVLLLLLTGSWAAARTGRPWWAGLLLGSAAAVKLFPAFLLVYFVARRQWRAVAAAVVGLAALTALTALVLGPDVYRTYFLEVLPRTSAYRGAWYNLSLSGLWCKLFDPDRYRPPVEVLPLVRSPGLALAGMALTLAAVTAVLARVLPRLRTREEADLGFSLTVIGMLLVSPITWEHYLVLLALPVVVLWRRWPRGGPGREALCLLLALLWPPPLKVMEHALILLGAEYRPDLGRWVATPLATATALAVPCYALTGLFLLGLLAAWLPGAAPGEKGEAAAAVPGAAGRPT